MLDFEVWKESIQKLFDKPEDKYNHWISGASHCPNCGQYIKGHATYATMTGCPYCSRSFLD